MADPLLTKKDVDIYTSNEKKEVTKWLADKHNTLGADMVEVHFSTAFSAGGMLYYSVMITFKLTTGNLCGKG